MRRSRIWSRCKDLGRLLAGNYELGLFCAGVYLVWRGLSAWSWPLGTVAVGMVCVALAIVPTLRRKDRPR